MRGYPVLYCHYVPTYVPAGCTCSGISFIDSTSLIRLPQSPHPAARGKTSVDWFFSFKLHIVVNDKARFTGFVLTSGNTDNRTSVPKLLRGLGSLPF
nr:transposase [Coleofasciculus sp. FACHB-1120]